MVLYFTGTGNSRYAAELLGHRLNDTVRDCTPLMQGGTTPRFHSVTPWVFVCPTYAWQIPHIFADFLTRCHFSGSRQAYFVMTCGGEIHNAPETNRKLCTRLGLEYMGTAELVMPENYIAMFNAPDVEKAKKIVAAAGPDIAKAVLAIKHGEKLPSKSGLGASFESGLVNDIFYAAFVKANAFRADQTCTGCGKCKKFCPLNNITLKNKKPVWGKHCTHCMACICYCPAEAIEYGRKSVGKPRYCFENLGLEKYDYSNPLK